MTYIYFAIMRNTWYIAVGPGFANLHNFSLPALGQPHYPAFNH